MATHSCAPRPRIAHPQDLGSNTQPQLCPYLWQFPLEIPLEEIIQPPQPLTVPVVTSFVPAFSSSLSSPKEVIFYIILYSLSIF